MDYVLDQTICICNNYVGLLGLSSGISIVSPLQKIITYRYLHVYLYDQFLVRAPTGYLHYLHSRTYISTVIESQTL